MLSGISDGDRVIACRPVHGGLLGLGPAVRPGTHGIVRGSPRGMLARTLTVEFDGGHLLRVSSHDVRRAMFGHGEQAWQRRTATRRGVKLGMLILWFPAALAVARYLLAGGSVGGLVAAAPMMALDAALRLAGALFGLGGAPLAVLLAAALAFHHIRGRAGRP